MIESCDIKLVCDRKIQSPCVLLSATERLKPPFLPSRRGCIRARAIFARFFWQCARLSLSLQPYEDC